MYTMHDFISFYCFFFKFLCILVQHDDWPYKLIQYKRYKSCVFVNSELYAILLVKVFYNDVEH